MNAYTIFISIWVLSHSHINYFHSFPPQHILNFNNNIILQNYSFISHYRIHIWLLLNWIFPCTIRVNLPKEILNYLMVATMHHDPSLSIKEMELLICVSVKWNRTLQGKREKGTIPQTKQNLYKTKIMGLYLPLQNL